MSDAEDIYANQANTHILAGSNLMWHSRTTSVAFNFQEEEVTSSTPFPHFDNKKE